MKVDFKGTLNIELPKSNEDRALSKRRLEPILGGSWESQGGAEALCKRKRRFRCG